MVFKCSQDVTCSFFLRCGFFYKTVETKSESKSRTWILFFCLVSPVILLYFLVPWLRCLIKKKTIIWKNVLFLDRKYLRKESSKTKTRRVRVSSTMETTIFQVILISAFLLRNGKVSSFWVWWDWMGILYNYFPITMLYLNKDWDASSLGEAKQGSGYLLMFFLRFDKAVMRGNFSSAEVSPSENLEARREEKTWSGVWRCKKRW